MISATGPLTGTPFPMGCGFMAAAKSPLTGTIFNTSCGGRLGVYLRKSGIDVLVLVGSASRPSYLLIDDGKAELRHGAFREWLPTMETRVQSSG